MDTRPNDGNCRFCNAVTVPTFGTITMRAIFGGSEEKTEMWFSAPTVCKPCAKNHDIAAVEAVKEARHNGLNMRLSATKQWIFSRTTELTQAMARA